MEKLKEILTSKVATSILVFIFSFLLGIYYLYKLGKK